MSLLERSRKRVRVVLSLAFLGVSLSLRAAEAPALCGRTPAIVTGVLDALGKKKCDDVTDGDLARVTFLSILAAKPESVPSLRSDDFAGMSGLKSLYLERLGVKTLPEDLLAPLDSLETLEIESTALVDISTGLLRGRDKLRRLVLKGAIPELPRGLLRGAPGLEQFLVRSDAAMRVPAGFFADAGPLRTLALVSPRGVTLEEKPFRALSELTSFSLSVDYGRVRTDLLTGLGDLQELYLSGWGELPQGIFDPVPRLQLLAIDSLSRLSEHLFRGLTQVQDLRISGRPALRPKLRELPPRAFTGLPHLIALSLDHNELTRLTPDQIVGWERLSMLKLQNNRLSDVSVLARLKQLGRGGLWLFGNPLPHVCPVAPADRCLFDVPPTR